MATTIDASPALFDAVAQTRISIPKISTDRYLMGKDGHPSPVHFDGECATGISHGLSFSAANAEVAVEVDGPSLISSAR
eukprot:9675444-Karenia_brevis.AAC.1